MGDSPIYHLPWPELSDPADVPAAMQDTAMATDGILNTFQTDTDTALDDMQDQISGATGSFVKLAHVELAAPAASIDMAAIPQTYKHLMLVFGAQSSAAVAGDFVMGRVNGNTSTGYYHGRLIGNNNTATATTSTSGTSAPIGYVGGASIGNVRRKPANIVFFPQYCAADHEPVWAGMMFGLTTPGSAVGLWNHLSGSMLVVVLAVNQITLTLNSGANFIAGSMFTLYGLKGD